MDNAIVYNYLGQIEKKKDQCYNKFDKHKTLGVFHMNIITHFKEILEENFNKMQ